MQMTRVPTERLIECLHTLEDTPGIVHDSTLSYLRIDDPTGPQLLNDIYDAMLDMHDIIPCFEGRQAKYLGFSRYPVLTQWVKQANGTHRIDFHYIQTERGRVAFPETARIHLYHTLPSSEFAMRYKQAPKRSPAARRGEVVPFPLTGS